MLMTNKYKISDLAKDFNISSKDAIAIITEITGTEKKAGATLNEQEIGMFFNKITKDNAVKDFKDYYSYLINVYGQGQFGGIGNCFSWKEGKGEAYCAGSFGNGATEIKLKCWIDPKDINWEETVYKNCYSYNT